MLSAGFVVFFLTFYILSLRMRFFEREVSVDGCDFCNYD